MNSGTTTPITSSHILQGTLRKSGTSNTPSSSNSCYRRPLKVATFDITICSSSEESDEEKKNHHNTHEKQSTTSPSKTFSQIPSSSQGSVIPSSGIVPPTPRSNFTLTPPVFSSSDENDSESEDLESILAKGDAKSLDLVRESFIKRKKQNYEAKDQEESNDDTNHLGLSVAWAGGKLGAAFYDFFSSELFLLPDIEESLSDCLITRSLYAQVSPGFVVVSSRSDDRLISVLTELCGQSIIDKDDCSDEGSQASEKLESVNNMSRSQLFLLPGKEFGPEACKDRVLSIKVPFEPKSKDQFEHRIFLTSLIPFTNEVMLRATGGLLKFLDKHAIEIFQMELLEGQTPVLDIKLYSMDDMLFVDNTAWTSLQIFNTESHPSSVKQGFDSSSKEGLSVYSLLNHCITKQGMKTLKHMLLTPTRNLKVLSRRHDVVHFLLDTNNTDFARAIRDCLKPIRSIPKLLYQLRLLHAKVSEWKHFQKTVYNCLLIGQISTALSSPLELLQEISNQDIIEKLHNISQELSRVVDFDESISRDRLVPKLGVDSDLDQKRQQYSHLPEIMAMVAAEEMKELPEFVTQCCVIYMPEIGYLLGISLWSEQLLREDMEIPGLDYMFHTSELVYYRSLRTKELDTILGDCQVSILQKESSVMIHLTEHILNYSKELLQIGTLVSELDCLSAFALAAAEYGFVRPLIVNETELLHIENGYHPLSALTCTFTPNSTEFANCYSKIVILTGPNASGKSVYLKQVGIIVIMALCGSFIPAQYARIPLFDRIFTRVHHIESISNGLSTFMADVSQMSQALRCSTSKSLVIVDEFGKGTTETDGISLLSASIQDFIDRREKSPTVILSTHFYSILEYLENAECIKLQTMDFLVKDTEICYLFKLKEGICDQGFADLVATASGIPQSVVQRSKEIIEVIKNQMNEAELVPQLDDSDIARFDASVSLAEEFLTIDFDQVDPLEYLNFLKLTFGFPPLQVGGAGSISAAVAQSTTTWRSRHSETSSPGTTTSQDSSFLVNQIESTPRNNFFESEISAVTPAFVTYREASCTTPSINPPPVGESEKPYPTTDMADSQSSSSSLVSSIYFDTTQNN